MKSSTNTGDNAGGAALPGHPPRLRYVDVVELSHQRPSEARRTPAQTDQPIQPDRRGGSSAGLRVQPALTTAKPVAKAIDQLEAAREAIAQSNREASKLGLGPRFFETLEQTRQATPALMSDDARWVFAVRVRREMQGGRAAIIVPESRKRLLRLANRLGLRDFDANLVIAIVQDDARTHPSSVPIPSDLVKGPLSLIRPAHPESREANEKLWWTIGVSVGLAILGCYVMIRWLGAI